MVIHCKSRSRRPFQLIAIDHLVKRHPVNTQDFGRLCDIPILLFKNPFNIVLFHLLKGSPFPDLDRGRPNEREVLHSKSPGLGKDHRTFDGVLEFPHISGPAVTLQPFNGIGGNPVYLLGGPMMGRFVDDPVQMQQAVITKTGGGVIVLPRGHYLHQMATLSVHAMQRQAAAACIQCRYCTDLCPRHNIGHGFETHRVMRAFGGGVDTAMGALQASMCSECGVCELFACPMRLSPRRINAMFKAKFKEEGLRYEGPREIVDSQSVLNAFRKVPTARLAIKLDIAQYMDLKPQDAGELHPRSVEVPLHQHTGAAALSQVRVGDTVKPGDVIGEIPEGALGARVHAPIGGVVTRVDERIGIVLIDGGS